jgi:hypothetical protein
MVKKKKGGRFMGSVKLEVLNPTGSDPPKGKGIGARRFDNLDGKRIGLVWNNKDYGDKLLEKVRELLKERYPTAQFSMYRLKECCIAPPEGELEKIGKQIDAVVYTLGD